MKIIFFGSDDFAATHLKRLINSSHEIVACVTQPDRPKNRGMKIARSPIKLIAQEYRIPVWQPTDMGETNFRKALEAYHVDLFIVIAYGRILPEYILEIPRLCALNIHGSWLPKYRGAAPINWAIINGETETGLTIIKMNTTMDAGDILAVKKIDIFPQDTAVTLRARMMREGAEFLLETLERSAQWRLQKQDETQVTYAPKLTKRLGFINWRKTARELHNLARGLCPWPGVYTFYQDKPLKIFSTKVLSDLPVSSAVAGEVMGINRQGIVVRTGSDTDQSCLLVQELQLAGGRRMDAVSFVRGHRLEEGHVFPSQNEK